MIAILILAPIIAVICGVIANAKGRSVPGWVVLGLVLPVIALLVLVFLPSLKAETAQVASASPAGVGSKASSAEPASLASATREGPAVAPPASAMGTLGISRDLGAGAFLLVIAAIAFSQTLNLSFGSGSSVGPGMMPRSISVLIAAFGALFVIQSLLAKGTAMDRWSIRGPIFVLGAALMFAWTIRPLGVIIAGPLAVMISSMADKDTRLVEIVPYAIILTLACIGLFSYGLRLPMPVMPTSAPWPLDQWL